MGVRAPLLATLIHLAYPPIHTNVKRRSAAPIVSHFNLITRIGLTIFYEPLFAQISQQTYIPECDIRENFDTNECPNIFVSTKLHE